MAAGGALNLSLLSRGVGEVTRNGSEKVDVIFEPQDYFNFVEESHERPFFLPPLQPRYGLGDSSQLSSRYGSKDTVYLPKTFTTRKGALLLFSEDMAHKTKQQEAKKHRSFGFHSHRDPMLTSVEESSDPDDNNNKSLVTVDDLAKSILTYGSFDQGGHINLKFMHKKRRYDFDRQIRPGFSAKRYLSTWTKTWDDTVLEKVISKGYLTEKSLFYYNPLLPHLSRRLNDDMSHYPAPYRLMRSMLMSPGSLSGYTFYRVRPESQETDYDFEEDEETTIRARSRARSTRSVKVISVDADGMPKEVMYGKLEPQVQKEVLTDLLVKSAVHYAMKKQQEYVTDYVEVNQLSDDGEGVRPIPRFDMQDAVETMLHDSEKKGTQKQVLDADLPEIEEKSQHSGSFKGSKLGEKRLSKGAALDSHRYQDDGASSVSSGSIHALPTGLPVLPPIAQTYTQLTPIGEASREHTQAFSLATHNLENKGDEEDEAWAGRDTREKGQSHRDQAPEDKKRVSSGRRRPRLSQQSLDLDGPVLGSGINAVSSSDSQGPGSTHSSGWAPPTLHKQQWKGSTQSLRSHGSRKASGSIVDGDAGSARGSVIFGPDGEVIKVGQSMKLSAREPDTVQDVQDAHFIPGLKDASDDSDAEVPDEWRKKKPSSGRRSDSIRRLKRDSPKSQVTEQEIIDTLTSHASKIAESVLSQGEGGQILEDDIRKAAALWMETHPARVISRSQSVQDLPDKTVIQEVMKAQKRNSAGPTVAEYRDQIKGNLMTALAKATGLDQSQIPADAEIDPSLLQQLADNSLKPEDIEIYHDEETGRSFIRSRNRQIAEAMGGVEKGHLYQNAAKNGDAGKKVSIPSDRAANADLGDLDIIKYGGGQIEEEAPGSEHLSQAGSKKSGAQSLVSGSVHEGDAKSSTGKSVVSFKGEMPDEIQKAMAEIESKDTSKKSENDAVSVRSGTSQGGDRKSRASDKTKKTTTPEKKEEFIVGKVKKSKELEELYGQKELPPGKPKEKKPKVPPAKGAKKGAKKGKGKGKKKEEEAAEPETAVEAVSPEKQPTPQPTPPPVEKAKTPKPATPESERYESPEQVNSEDEEDFIIVRDESFSPEPEISGGQLNITTSQDEEPEEEQMSANGDDEDMTEADRQRMISNREARAAKRAAAAEKRRLEVERKRREREEQLKKEKEELERQDQLKNELEETRRRKEEERRLRKQREQEEQDEMMKEEMEQRRREQLEVDKERRRKEEYARKLEEMRKKQQEEEKRRAEEAERKRLEEEERKREEEELMAKMAEEERIEYERKKREEEEERKRKEEEDRRKREEEAQRALEEARRLAEEMARKQAELEARLRFNRSLQLEANGMEHTQDITKAFVFSYYELLQWLGLDIPEFELLKLNQY